MSFRETWRRQGLSLKFLSSDFPVLSKNKHLDFKSFLPKILQTLAFYCLSRYWAALRLIQRNIWIGGESASVSLFPLGTVRLLWVPGQILTGVKNKTKAKIRVGTAWRVSLWQTACFVSYLTAIVSTWFQLITSFWELLRIPPRSLRKTFQCNT